MRRFMIVAVLVVVALAVGAPAGSVSRADTAPAATIEQTMPALAYNSQPEEFGYLVVWIEDRGLGPDIYAKRLYANALPQGGASMRGWQVLRDEDPPSRNKPPRGPRADPALVYNPVLKEYLLVYSEVVDDPNGWEVFGVRVSAAGYARGTPRRLASGPGDQRHPDVAIVSDDRLPSNDYLVVWDDNGHDIDEVWALRLQANGLPRGKAYPLVHGTSSASDPTTSGTAVAWVDDRRGQTDIYSMRLRNGLPGGAETAVTSSVREAFSPRYGSSGLVWNEFNPLTGLDIMGVEVIETNRTRGGNSVILVPAADQTWPDMDNGVVVFADNRTGDYDLYAVRVLVGGRIRSYGHDYPVLTD